MWMNIFNFSKIFYFIRKRKRKRSTQFKFFKYFYKNCLSLFFEGFLFFLKLRLSFHILYKANFLEVIIWWIIRLWEKNYRHLRCSRHERNGRAKGGEGLKIRYERGQREAEVGMVRGWGPTFSPSFNSLTKDGLINKSITHTRGAGRMNAYRVDKDRGEDVDKIGGCPRVLVAEQRGARHGINVWPPRQNIHAMSRVPADSLTSNRESGPIALSSPSFPFHSFLVHHVSMTVNGSILKLSRITLDHWLLKCSASNLLRISKVSILEKDEKIIVLTNLGLYL